MNRQADISEKDMRLLGEYLDNALSVMDRAKFEKRLQQSPELQQALEDMTALKASLRSLPVRTVPRQFTLTRAEAQKARRGRFLIPTFGWASGVCMILLAVVFGSEFIFSNFSAPQNVAAPEVFSVMSETVQEDAPSGAKALDSQAVFLLNWVEVGGKGGSGGAVVGNDATALESGLGGGEEMSEPLTAEESAETEDVPMLLSGARESVEPLIFGIREDALGQVILVKPVEAAAGEVFSEPQTDETVSQPSLSVEVKLILAGLAATFGLIWLVLRHRR